MIYYKRQFLSFKKKTILFELSIQGLTMSEKTYSWNNLTKIDFIVRKDNDSNIIHYLQFIIDQKEFLIDLQKIKKFNKTSFLEKITFYQESFKNKQEDLKEGFSLTPIEDILTINYPSNIKYFIENKKNEFSCSFLQNEFLFFSAHISKHNEIIELSNKISKIQNPLIEHNSLVIAHQKNDKKGVLFLSTTNKLVDANVYYYHFDFPSFSAIQLVDDFFDLIEPKNINYLLNKIQLTSYEIPIEKGCLKWSQSTINSNHFSIKKSFNYLKFGTEISIISSFNISTENNTIIDFEYETIFMDSEKTHIDIYQKDHSIIQFILNNLVLSNLKFAEQYWIQKMGNNDFEKKLDIKKPN